MTRRVILASGAVIASAVLMSFSLAMAIGATRPGLAATMAPYLSRPKSRVAELMLASTLQGGKAQTVEPSAREAVLLDPFNVTAVRTLAYIERLDNNTNRADALFSYANELTRRDIGVNLDYVMEAAKQGDAVAAVRHFDLGLRTSRASWDLLFPIINRVSADPAIVPALADVLAKDPQWKWPFLDGLVREGPNSLVTAQLLAELEKDKPVQNDDLHRTLIGRLLDDGHYETAFARYRALARSKGVQSLTNGEFERNPLGVPFEWTALSGGTVDTGIAENASSAALGKSFYFRVPPSADGELLRFTAVLAPGPHRLSAHVGPALEGSAGELTFAVECQRTGAVLDDRTVAQPKPGIHTFEFAAPRDCRGVRLYLKARSLDDDSAWVSWLDSLELDGGDRTSR